MFEEGEGAVIFSGRPTAVYSLRRKRFSKRVLHTVHVYLNLLQSISDPSRTGTQNFCLPQETPRSSASFLTTSYVYSLTITEVHIIYFHTYILVYRNFTRDNIKLNIPCRIHHNRFGLYFYNIFIVFYTFYEWLKISIFFFLF